MKPALFVKAPCILGTKRLHINTTFAVGISNTTWDMSVIPDSRTGAQLTAGPTQSVAVIARERDDRFLRRFIGVNVDNVGEIQLLAVDW